MHDGSTLSISAKYLFHIRFHSGNAVPKYDSVRFQAEGLLL